MSARSELNVCSVRGVTAPITPPPPPPSPSPPSPPSVHCRPRPRRPCRPRLRPRLVDHETDLRFSAGNGYDNNWLIEQVSGALCCRIFGRQLAGSRERVPAGRGRDVNGAGSGLWCSFTLGAGYGQKEKDMCVYGRKYLGMIHSELIEIG